MNLLHRNSAIGAAVIAACVAATPAFAVGAASAPSRKAADTVYARGPNATPPAAAAGMRAAVQRSGQLRVIVGLDMTLQRGLSGAAAADQGARLSSAQQRVARRALGTAATDKVVAFRTIPFVTLTVGPDALERLLSDPEVLSIQEDAADLPTLSESVPLINGDDVWAAGFDGTGRVVAVLDTGAQSSHPMLSGKVVSEACYSTNDSTYGATTLCPGGATSSTATGSGANCDAAVEGCDHGTHVSSTAVGSVTGLRGVAPGAKLVSIQVFSRFPDGTARSFSSDQIRGLERVLALKGSLNIDAANMSLGGGAYSAYCDAQDPARKAAIDNLLAAGVATVIASGNSYYTGYIGAPACISTAVTVGATTKSDLISSYSNHSSLVDLLAPGSNIRAAVPGGYANFYGTSMATPHVAGAFALMRDVNPTASVATILSALSDTGVPLSTREGGATLTPKPRIDLLAASKQLGLPPEVEGRDWQFSSASDADDWSPVVGSWKVSNGLYASSKRKGWVASVASAGTSSADIVARLGRKLGKEKKFFSNTGIVYKSSYDPTTGLLNGYFAAYNACPTNKKNECQPGSKNQPGLALLYRFVDYGFGDDTGSAYVICAKRSKVNVDGQNKIEISTDGSSHLFKLNGKTVCSTSDSAFAANGVGVAAFAPSAKKDGAKLDYFTIDPISSNKSPAMAGIEDHDEDDAPAAVATAARALPTSALEGAGDRELAYAEQ